MPGEELVRQRADDGCRQAGREGARHQRAPGQGEEVIPAARLDDREAPDQDAHGTEVRKTANRISRYG